MSQAHRIKKEANIVRTSTYHLFGFLRGVLREVGFWLLMLIALGAFVALITFDPEDPAWTHTAHVTQFHNIGGLIGAWFADLNLYFFGYPAYLLPAGIALTAWRLFVQGALLRLDGEIVLLRILGFLVMLSTACGLCAWYLQALPHTIPGASSAGGLVGIHVRDFLFRAFHAPGAPAFMIILLMAGLTLATGLSWLVAIDWIGQMALKLFDQIGAVVTLSFARRSPEVADVPPLPEPIPPVPSVSLIKPPIYTTPAPVEELPTSVAISLGPDVMTLTPTLPTMVEAAASTLSPAFVPDVTEADMLAAPPPLPPDMETKVNPVHTLTSPPSETTYLAPPLDLLDRAPPSVSVITTEALEQMARRIEILLRHFGIESRVMPTEPGPVITRFDVHPASSAHLHPVSTIANDLAFSLSVPSVRVVDGIPGKQPIWLEVPNAARDVIALRDILEAPAYAQATQPLTLALGKDGSGHPLIGHLTKMQHLLLAGVEGEELSGLLHAILVSLLYKTAPSQVELVLASAKTLPLAHYGNIPHLLQLVTDAPAAIDALQDCLDEMDRRTALLAAKKVRTIAGLRQKKNDPDATLPFRVIVIAELADVLAITNEPVESHLIRLARKGHTVGIHLIVATQRLSADVLTGSIRACLPSKIAAQVLWPVDSCTILDHTGADCLLGKGDMLYLPAGSTVPQRVHGALLDDREVLRVTNYLRKPAHT